MLVLPQYFLRKRLILSAQKTLLNNSCQVIKFYLIEVDIPRRDSQSPDSDAKLTHFSLKKKTQLNRLAILDTLEVNSDAGGGVRSTAGASVNLPNSEKFSVNTYQDVKIYRS